MQDVLWQNFMETGSVNAFLDYNNFIKLGYDPIEGEDADI